MGRIGVALAAGVGRLACVSKRRPSVCPSRDGIIGAATDVSGNLAAAGLGALVAGPDGIMAGAVVGPSLSLALKQTVAQLSGWAGGRQVERVSEAIRSAAGDLERLQAEGWEIREDFREQAGFRERAGHAGRASEAAQEVAEGILQTVAFSYEQRKAPYLGHLLASIAVRPDLLVADAHRLTRLVGELSYRQLACLAAIGTREMELDAGLRDVALRVDGRDRMNNGTAEEIEQLSKEHGLLVDPPEPGAPSRVAATVERLVAPGDLMLTERGHFLFDLLQLDTMLQEDRRNVIGELLG
jgi:hypothetical protein